MPICSRSGSWKLGSALQLVPHARFPVLQHCRAFGKPRQRITVNMYSNATNEGSRQAETILLQVRGFLSSFCFMSTSDQCLNLAGTGDAQASLCYLHCTAFVNIGLATGKHVLCALSISSLLLPVFLISYCLHHGAGASRKPVYH